MTRVVVVQFLVPSRDREGKPYGRAVLRSLRAELAQRFGGWSLASPAPLPGAWTNPSTGTVETDRSWRYEVAMPEAEVPRFDEFLAGLGAQLGQDAMYRVVLGEAAVIPSRQRG